MTVQAAKAVPFFCADCDNELHGRGIEQRDGRTICGKCQTRHERDHQGKAQREFFVEQETLFNPASRANVEGFIGPDGGFHPIRGTEDYNEFLAGDFDSDKQAARKQWSKQVKERKDAKEAAEFYEQEAKRESQSEKPQRSLAEFVRSRGGIAISRGGMFAGELQRLSPKELGTTGLLNQNARTTAGGVQTAEDVMDQANEDGYRDSNG